MANKDQNSNQNLKDLQSAQNANRNDSRETTETLDTVNPASIANESAHEALETANTVKVTPETEAAYRPTQPVNQVPAAARQPEVFGAERQADDRTERLHLTKELELAVNDARLNNRHAEVDQFNQVLEALIKLRNVLGDGNSSLIAHYPVIARLRQDVVGINH